MSSRWSRVRPPGTCMVEVIDKGVNNIYQDTGSSGSERVTRVIIFFGKFATGWWFIWTGFVTGHDFFSWFSTRSWIFLTVEKSIRPTLYPCISEQGESEKLEHASTGRYRLDNREVMRTKRIIIIYTRFLWNVLITISITFVAQYCNIGLILWEKMKPLTYKQINGFHMKHLGLILFYLRVAVYIWALILFYLYQKNSYLTCESTLPLDTPHTPNKMADSRISGRWEMNSVRTFRQPLVSVVSPSVSPPEGCSGHMRMLSESGTCHSGCIDKCSPGLWRHQPHDVVVTSHCWWLRVGWRNCCVMFDWWSRWLCSRDVLRSDLLLRRLRPEKYCILWERGLLKSVFSFFNEYDHFHTTYFFNTIFESLKFAE